MPRKMTKAERESFLADVRVGVLSVVEEGRGPLTVPIWYAYVPGGELTMWMERSSRKASLLERAGRFSLCVQNEQSPYQYVSVEGPISVIEAAELERDVRPLARRYLGVEDGDAYSEAAADDDNQIVVRMRPERWLTGDYR